VVKPALEIYKQYQQALEINHHGEFVVIDVRGRGIYIGHTPEAAHDEARRVAPYGVFHLIRVGFQAAFVRRGW
jgi:3-mercaptopyruvate sulfurtransferase SseA